MGRTVCWQQCFLLVQGICAPALLDAVISDATKAEEEVAVRPTTRK